MQVYSPYFAAGFVAGAEAAAVGAKIFTAFRTVNVNPQVNGTMTTSHSNPIHNLDDLFRAMSVIAISSTFRWTAAQFRTPRRRFDRSPRRSPMT